LEAAIVVLIGDSTGEGIDVSLADSVVLVTTDGVLTCFVAFEEVVLSLDKLYLKLTVLVCPEDEGVIEALLYLSS
jgi:hypothetical protein